MQTQDIPIVRGWYDPYPHCLHKFVLELPSNRNDYFKVYVHAFLTFYFIHK